MIDFVRKWDRTIVLIFTALVTTFGAYFSFKHMLQAHAKIITEHSVRFEKVDVTLLDYEKNKSAQTEINRQILSTLVDIKQEIKEMRREMR